MRLTKTLRRRKAMREPDRDPVFLHGSRPVVIRRMAKGHWRWQSHDGHSTRFGYAPSWPAALALGLAALDTASVRTSR